MYTIYLKMERAHLLGIISTILLLQIGKDLDGIDSFHQLGLKLQIILLILLLQMDHLRHH